LRKNLYKNSIYFALLVHCQEYRNELKENIYVYSICSFSRTLALLRPVDRQKSEG
jgi:hypothetical protein